MRFKLTLQYVGTTFHGWQSQPHHVTVQTLLQNALGRIFGRRIHVQGASRTDAGVHAVGQVCHFDLKPEEVRDKNGIAFEERLRHGLNAVLPEEVSAIALQKAREAFHATDQAQNKIYDYYLFLSTIRSPFLSGWSWRIPYPLDLKAMRQAARDLIGRHDFAAFCAADSTAKTTIRHLKRVSVSAVRDSVPPLGVLPGFPGKLVRIRCEGAGFLKHMVRNIVGTLVYVGRGAMKTSEVKKILHSRDRKTAGPTAPPQGLVLVKITY